MLSGRWYFVFDNENRPSLAYFFISIFFSTNMLRDYLSARQNILMITFPIITWIPLIPQWSKGANDLSPVYLIFS